MDDRMKKTGLFYVRFMDDWIVLSPNRWKLKKAIQIVNQTLNELKVEKHPDKTFIGQVAKGFDSSGCFSLRVASPMGKVKLSLFVTKKHAYNRCLPSSLE